METDFISFLTQQTGLGALAALSLYLLNKAHKDEQASATAFAAAQREDKIILMRVMEETTKALIALTIKQDMLLGMASRSDDYINDQRREAKRAA